MVHLDKIDRYLGSFQELAEDLGNLRYDALAGFLRILAAKLKADAAKDEAANRPKLAAELRASATAANTCASSIDRAWQISAPHM
jgi:hypothetical protein